MINVVVVVAVLALMTFVAVRSRRPQSLGKMGLVDTARAVLGLTVIAKETRQNRRSNHRRQIWAEMRQHGGRLPVTPRQKRREEWRDKTWGSR